MILYKFYFVEFSSQNIIWVCENFIMKYANVYFVPRIDNIKHTEIAPLREMAKMRSEKICQSYFIFIGNSQMNNLKLFDMIFKMTALCY